MILPYSGGSSISTQIIQGRKCVVSESYDEILFTEPTPFMHTLLTNTRKLYSGGGHTVSAHLTKKEGLGQLQVCF